MGSQRNRKRNQDTPIQDLSSTSPVTWLRNLEDHKGWWTKIEQLLVPMPETILRIRWQQRISNNRVVEMADINNISCEIRRRRWNWLGHVLRREDGNDCFTALGWTPEVRRARGRPKTTWRRTVEKERDKAGWKSWNVAKSAARNRECWAKSVTALCAYWREGKWWWWWWCGYKS